MSNIFLFHRFNKGVSTSWKSDTGNKTNYSQASVSKIAAPDSNPNRPRTPFKANPLRQYRRRRNINLVNSSKPRLVDVQEMPNSVILHNDKNLSCIDASGIIQSIQYQGNKNLMNNDSPCDCTNAEAVAKKRLQHKTILSKKYYTRHEDLRKARGQTYLDRQFKNKDDVCCPVIDKPNNSKYHVQGAVDAGTRLQRIKLEAIQSSKNKYLGNYTETFSDKSKLNHDNCKIYGKKC